MTGSIKTVLTLLACGFLLSACSTQEPPLPADKLRDYANELYNRQLFKQSIAEYERFLNGYAMSDEEQANLTYIIANIYFDKVNDYENALAYYIRLKHLYPQNELVTDANKRIVACLERLERSVDAQQALKESTYLDDSKVRKSRPGEVIAMIGSREITTGDLEYEMNQLPPFMLAQIKDGSRRLEFLKQLIATELLYGTAKRKGLDSDAEVLEGAFQAKKNIMVQKLLQSELSKNIEFEEEDLRTWYRANSSRFVTDADSTSPGRQLAFEEARSQVTQDYIMSKQQAAYERLLERMMRAEDVKIYENKIQ